MNYYENLPNDMIINIETFLPYKPSEIEQMIQSPPNKYKKMLRNKWEKKFYNIETQHNKEEVEFIKRHNKEIESINENRIKFFMEFNIEKKKNRLPANKEKWYIKEYKITEHRDISLLSFIDHPEIFITNNKNHIVISSHYGGTETEHKHIEAGFKKYNKTLYNNDCTTYFIII